MTEKETFGKHKIDVLVDEIGAWAVKTYEHPTWSAILHHLLEEVEELKKSVVLGAPCGSRSHLPTDVFVQGVSEEGADIFMILATIFHRCGLSMEEAVLTKLEKNLHRKPEPPNAHGVQHLYSKGIDPEAIDSPPEKRSRKAAEISFFEDSEGKSHKVAPGYRVYLSADKAVDPSCTHQVLGDSALSGVKECISCGLLFYPDESPGVSDDERYGNRESLEGLSMPQIEDENGVQLLSKEERIALAPKTQPAYESLLEVIATTRARKVAQYGEARYEDPFALSIVSVMVDIRRKYQRVLSGLFTGDRIERAETVREALLDMGNYCLMGVQVLDSSEEGDSEILSDLRLRDIFKQ